MAKFTTKADEIKWNSLAGNSKTSFDKLLKGTATDADLAKLGSTVAAYSDLAKSVFDSGLDAIEKRANHLNQLSEEKHKKRTKVERTPEQVEKLYKSNKKKSMKELAPELLDFIEEIETKLNEVNQEVHDATAKQTSEFSKLHDFLTSTSDVFKTAPKVRKPRTKAKTINPPITDFFADSDDLDFDIGEILNEVKKTKKKQASDIEVIKNILSRPSSGLNTISGGLTNYFGKDKSDSGLDHYLNTYVMGEDGAGGELARYTRGRARPSKMLGGGNTLQLSNGKSNQLDHYLNTYVMGEGGAGGKLATYAGGKGIVKALGYSDSKKGSYVKYTNVKNKGTLLSEVIKNFAKKPKKDLPSETIDETSTSGFTKTTETPKTTNVFGNYFSNLKANYLKSKSNPVHQSMLKNGLIDTAFSSLMKSLGFVNKRTKNKFNKDSYFDRFKKLLTPNKKTKKDANNTLLAGLALLLMSPQILTSVGEMVSKYFNWSSIKDVLSLAFDTLKEKAVTIGTGIIDSVKSFFGITKTDKSDKPDGAKKGASLTPNYSNGVVKQSDKDLTKPTLENLIERRKNLQEALAKNPNSEIADNLKAQIKTLDYDISNFSNASSSTTSSSSNTAASYANSASSMVSNNANATISGEGSSSGDSVNVNSSGANVSNNADSSIISSASKSGIFNNDSTYNAYGNNNDNSTQISSLNKAPFTYGTAMDLEPTSSKSLNYGNVNTDLEASGNTPINLGSFGFKAAINDSLNIANAGLFYT